MSFLPKIRFLGKPAKKIYPLTFQVNIKIYFARFASNIKFCIKKPIRQQSHNIFMTLPQPPNLTDKKTKTPPLLAADELPPELAARWSKKQLLAVFTVCLLVAALAIFGFLLYKEYNKGEVAGLSLPPRLISLPVKLYNNDYWGVKFSYPGDWSPVIGSFDEGNYYFSSQNINFLEEQADNEAIVKLETYHNISFSTFRQWLAGREQNYFPRAKIVDEHDITINGYDGKEYVYIPDRPEWPQAAYIDRVVLARDQKNIAIFYLITKNSQSHDNFQPIFSQILNSVQFYNGFGS